MSVTPFAKVLGRRGGKSRAKRLSPERKRQIASMGGRARSESFQAAQRIEENFRYLEAVRQLTGRHL